MALSDKEIKKFLILRYILWNQEDEVKRSCEIQYDSIFLPFGPWQINLEASTPPSPWMINLEASAPSTKKSKKPKNINVKTTTIRLDLRRAPKWKEATEKYGIPKVGILPAMGVAQSNQSMLVIEDYVKLYNMLTKEGRPASPKGKAKGHETSVKRAHALVIGNPGIGKSWALDYILYRRLLEGQPTLYRRNSSESFFFTASGVEYDEQTIEKHLDVLQKGKTEVWVLVDTARQPRATDLRRPFNRLIQATPPNIQEYAQWAKPSFEKYYWLDMWKWEEMYLLSTLRSFSPGLEKRGEDFLDKNIFVDRLWTIFSLFGGEPGLVRTLDCHSHGNGVKFSQSVRDHIQTVKLRCKQAVAELIKEERFVLKASDQSHILLATRPFSEHHPCFGPKRSIKVGTDVYTDARSPFIASILQRELYKREKTASLSVMKGFLDHGRARAFADTIFDELCFRVSSNYTVEVFSEAQEFIEFDLKAESTEQLRLTFQNRAKREIAFGGFLNCAIPGSTEVFTSYQDLKERTTDMSGRFKVDKLGVYFRPKNRYFAGIDALVFYREHGRAGPIYLALFQHTSGLDRPLDVSRLKELFNALPENVKTKGREVFGPLVFVTTAGDFYSFQQQSYYKASVKDSALWQRRFPQLKICMKMEYIRALWDSQPERFRTDRSLASSSGKRKTTPENSSPTGTSSSSSKRSGDSLAGQVKKVKKA